MPKPTQQEPTDTEATTDAPSSVIELAARTMKAGTAATTVVEAEGRVTVRPKPEKRKNAKQRAMERNRKDKPAAVEVAAVTPVVGGLSTAHPKPEKRKNAKERAKEKFAKKATDKTTGDGTTPDTTVKAKSKVDTKAKSRKSKAAA